MRHSAFLVALGIGVAVFASTNIDDILLLSAFFADRRLTTRSIVIGQFVGIGALVAASAVAAFAAITVPAGWVALLGFVPLGLGVRKLWLLWKRSADDDESSETSELLQNREIRIEQRTHSQILAVTG